MKTAYIFFIFSFFICSELYAEKLLSDALKISCHKNGGKIVNQYKCPISKKNREGQFCLIKIGEFYNGCTGLDSGYGEIFFEACRTHDYCYHHEPITTGKMKTTCDFEFLDNLLAICDKRPDLRVCRLAAKGIYKAVDYFGNSSWGCSNTILTSETGNILI